MLIRYGMEVRKTLYPDIKSLRSYHPARNISRFPWIVIGSYQLRQACLLCPVLCLEQYS